MDEKTIVLFRMFPDGEIVAVFPEVAGSLGEVVFYAHVGQHGSGPFEHIMDITRAAKASEYDDLKKELTEHYGYDLDVRRVYVPRMVWVVTDHAYENLFFASKSESKARWYYSTSLYLGLLQKISQSEFRAIWGDAPLNKDLFRHPKGVKEWRPE